MLVLTGISVADGTSRYPYEPDLVIESVAELVGRTGDPFGGVNRS